MAAKTYDNNDDEETNLANLKEALLSHNADDDGNGSSDKQLLQEEEIDDYAHCWNPCKKGIVVLILIWASCFKLWWLVRPANQVGSLPLQEGSKALLLAEEQQQQEQEQQEETELPMDFFKVVSMQEVLNQTNMNMMFTGPIPPPFHPHHSASVTDSSRMGPDGSVEYRRDINAPCEFGMLLFSVGPAKDSLPYTYELYNDAYLYSDNNGLCMLYPSYNGYQTSKSPLWNPTDPLQVVLKPLDRSVMHWISSRVFDPYHSKNKQWDRTKVGDYAIIAKHNFYDPGFYKGLKAEINSWK